MRFGYDFLTSTVTGFLEIHARAYLANRLKDLAAQKGCRIEAGAIRPDHIHMLISIPPKYSVAAIVSYIKGKSAIAVARDLNGRKRNFSGEHFWARGYFVSAAGLDEETIRSYVERQMIEDLRLDKLEK